MLVNAALFLFLLFFDYAAVITYLSPLWSNEGSPLLYLCVSFLHVHGLSVESPQHQEFCFHFETPALTQQQHGVSLHESVEKALTRQTHMNGSWWRTKQM